MSESRKSSRKVLSTGEDEESRPPAEIDPEEDRFEAYSAEVVAHYWNKYCDGIGMEASVVDGGTVHIGHLPLALIDVRWRAARLDLIPTTRSGHDFYSETTRRAIDGMRREGFEVCCYSLNLEDRS